MNEAIGWTITVLGTLFLGALLLTMFVMIFVWYVRLMLALKDFIALKTASMQGMPKVDQRRLQIMFRSICKHSGLDRKEVLETIRKVSNDMK